MTPRTIEYMREELLNQRREVLDAVCMSLDDFRDRIREGLLEGDEWYYADRLEEITFLLGEDSA